MSNLTPIQIVEQINLNKSITSRQGDAQLFRLLLAMANDDVTQTLRIKEDKAQLPSKQLNSHYRNPSFKQSNNDFLIQHEYSKSIQNQDFIQLRLLACIYPQPLSAADNALHIDEVVVENSALPARKRLQELYQGDAEQDLSRSAQIEIEQQPTELFDILQALDQIKI